MCGHTLVDTICRPLPPESTATFDSQLLSFPLQGPAPVLPNCTLAVFSPPILASRLNSQVCAAQKVRSTFMQPYCAA